MDDVESSQFVSHFKLLCLWECLSRPILVGQRFDSRLLISNRYLCDEEPEDTSASSEVYRVDACFLGLMHMANLPASLRSKRIGTGILGVHVSGDGNSPRPSEAGSAGTTETAVNWLTRVHWLLSPNGEEPPPERHSVSSEKLETQSTPRDAPITLRVTNDKSVHEAEAHSLSQSPTPSRTSYAETLEADLNDLHSRNFPFQLPSGYDPVNHHCFCASPIQSFRIRRKPNSTITPDYRAFALAGYIPCSMPPSYNSSDLRYEYLFILSIVKVLPSGQSRNVFSIHYPMRVFGSSRSVMSSHDLLNLYVHLRDKSHFILPPPPIYPPLPPTFLSPSILKLQRLFGGDSATIAKDRPIPLVLLRLDLSTPEEISASIQKSDAGFAYIKWATSIHSPSTATNHSTDRKPGQIRFKDLIDEKEYERVGREFAELPNEEKCSKFFLPHLVEFDHRQIKSSLGLRTPSVRFREPLDIYVPEIAAINEFVWRGSDWRQELKQNGFLCTSEPEPNSSRYLQSKAYNVSIGTHFICQMNVIGGMPVSEEIETLLFPPVRDYTKNALQADSVASRLFLTSPELLLLFDFSSSRVTVAEISVKITAVQTLTQPPLGVAESQTWSAVRDQQLHRSSPRTPSLSVGARRYSSPMTCDRLTPRKSLISGATALSSKTLISRKTQVVYSRIINVLHQSQTPHKIIIPPDVQNSLHNELVNLSFQLDVEFCCVAHNGELLELYNGSESHRVTSASSPASPAASNRRLRVSSDFLLVKRSLRPPPSMPSSDTAGPPSSPVSSDSQIVERRVSGIPFLVLNGPLQPKNVLKAVWSATLVYVNDCKRANLLEHVGTETRVTSDMLLEKAECNLKGQCTPKPPQRHLSFS